MITPRRPRRWHKPRYILEAIPVFLFYGLSALCKPATASAIGGWLGRAIGPRMGVTRRARRNLQRALPELGPERHAAIIKDMWDNLGRNFAEEAHLAKLVGDGLLSRDSHEILEAARAENRPCILISGHIGNWEAGPILCKEYGLPLAVIYRAPNNPYVDWLIRHAREKVASHTIPKGAAGAIQLMRHLRKGGHAGILIDQKQNEGIPVPFFGHDAYTTTAPAEFAIRFNCKVLVVRVRRDKAKLTLDCIPMTPPGTGDRAADAAAFTRQLTAQLESWIRERPHEWLWLHNRWPNT